MRAFINAFHVAFVAPLLIYVAILNGQNIPLSPNASSMLLGLGIGVGIYHVYRLADAMGYI